MKLPFAGTSSVPSSLSKARAGSVAAAFILFACLWLELINHLRSEWTFNPQYSYGWSVPFLALYLIWRRWRNRPSAADKVFKKSTASRFKFRVLIQEISWVRANGMAAAVFSNSVRYEMNSGLLN